MADGASGQSGMTHVMLVGVCACTRHTRPPQTSTDGAAVPLAKSLPVRVIVVFSAARALETAVSVGVALEANEKEHGVSPPDDESLRVATEHEQIGAT